MVSEVVFELRERQGKEGLPSSFLDCSEDMVRKLMLVMVIEGLDLRTSAGAKMVLAESLMKGSKEMSGCVEGSAEVVELSTGFERERTNNVLIEGRVVVGSGRVDGEVSVTSSSSIIIEIASVKHFVVTLKRDALVGLNPEVEVHDGTGVSRSSSFPGRVILFPPRFTPDRPPLPAPCRCPGLIRRE